MRFSKILRKLCHSTRASNYLDKSIISRATVADPAILQPQYNYRYHTWNKNEIRLNFHSGKND